MSGKSNGRQVRAAETNEEARRRHVRLPHSGPGVRGSRFEKTLSGRPSAKRRHVQVVRLIQSVKLSRGCESGCCPVGGGFFAEDLAFHHCVGKKLGALSKINSRWAALREMEKCLVLCHICHGRVHRGRIDIREVIERKWPGGVVEENLKEESQGGQLALF
jgi:hypothetical protein